MARTRVCAVSTALTSTYVALNHKEKRDKEAFATAQLVPGCPVSWFLRRKQFSMRGLLPVPLLRELKSSRWGKDGHLCISQVKREGAGSLSPFSLR